MENKQKILKAISKLKIYIGPFTQSTVGAIVPFYNDSRDIYSHPKIVNLIVNELAKKIKKYKQIKLLVGIPMTGIPLAMALSLKTNIPFAYLNPKRKKFLRKRAVEGDYNQGIRAALIDDAMGFGQTKIKSIRECKKDGVIIKHIFCFNNAWHPKNITSLKKIRGLGITFNALYTRKDLNLYLFRKGIISKTAHELHQAYLNNPKSWHKNKNTWQKFLIWRDVALKTKKL